MNAEILVNYTTKHFLLFNFMFSQQLPNHFLELFMYAGQNLGLMKSSKKLPTPEKAIETITTGWFDECKDGDMDIIDKFRHLE